MAILTGDGGSNILTGGADADDIAGGGGGDTLAGGGGSDIIYSGTRTGVWTRPYFGNPWTEPTLDTGTAVDTVNADDGDDQVFGGYGDNLYGGTGTDALAISFQGASSGITIDFRQVSGNGSVVVGGGTISSFEITLWIEGSNFDDTITDSDGSGNFQPIFGRGGNDTITGGYYTGNIYGGSGNDVITRPNSPYAFETYGEDGDDTLTAGFNGGLLDGGTGHDILRGSASFDTQRGGDGNDQLDGAGAQDELAGGTGNDTVYGGSGDDQIEGNGGDDTLYGDQSLIAGGGGSAGTDRLWGGAGADTIYGDGGADQLWSGERDGTLLAGLDDAGLERDRLFGGAGDDTLSLGLGDDGDGGADIDVLRLSLAGAATGLTLNTGFFVAGGSFTLFGGTLQNFETFAYLRTSELADTITVATHASPLTVNAGGGDDVITTDGSAVVVLGGAGDDRLLSGAAGDTFDGGSGIDTVDYGGYLSGVTVTLGLNAGQSGSGAGGDTLVNVENIAGSAQGDTLSGGNDANAISGWNGADTLNGNGGNDVLEGGNGADTLNGGDGNDDLDGDYGGFDNAVDHLWGGAGDDQLRLGANDFGDGGTGFDTLFIDLFNQTQGTTIDLSLMWTGGTGSNGSGTVSGFERLIYILGSNGDDTITIGTGGFVADGFGPPFVRGFEGNDRLVGGDGRELLQGDEGDDVIIGLGGDDQLLGSEGSDRIEGGDGNDNMIGGIGADTLIGGTGSDTYTYTEGNAPSEDMIVEVAGDAGTDVLYMVPLARITDAAFAGVRNIEVAHFSTLDDTAGDEVVLGALFQATGIRTVIASADIDATALGANMTFVLTRPNIRALSVRAGSGDDVFSFGAQTLPPFVSPYTLAGGAGYDTLVFASAAEASSLVAGFNQPALIVSGFEAVRLIGQREIAVAGGPDIAGRAETYQLTLTDAVVAAGQTFMVDGRGLNVNVAIALGANGEIGGAGANADTLRSDTLFLDASGLSATRAVYLEGGATNDTAQGGAGNDALNGNGGNDVLNGGGGADTLDGGTGNDALDGGAGIDTASYASANTGVSVSLALTGAQDTGQGNDTLTGIENLTGSASADVLTGNGGANALNGGDGADWLRGDGGTDTITGGDGADSAWGGDGDDLLAGGDGDDTIFGGAGNDTATYAAAAARVEVDLAWLEDQNTRGAGVDTLVSIENVIGSAFGDALAGDAGANWLTGGGGADVLTGGGGADTFVVRAIADTAVGAADRITDFGAGDRIDLSAIDADTSAAPDSAFTFIGGAAFHGTAGELRATASGADWLVEGDVDGDGAADFAILVTAPAPLAATDFIL